MPKRKSSDTNTSDEDSSNVIVNGSPSANTRERKKKKENIHTVGENDADPTKDIHTVTEVSTDEDTDDDNDFPDTNEFVRKPFPLKEEDQILFEFDGHVLEGHVTVVTSKNVRVEVDRTVLANVSYPWNLSKCEDDTSVPISAKHIHISDKTIVLKLDINSESIFSCCRKVKDETNTTSRHYTTILGGFKDFWLNVNDTIQLIKQGGVTKDQDYSRKCSNKCQCNSVMKPSKKKKSEKWTNTCLLCPFHWICAKVIAQTKTHVRVCYNTSPTVEEDIPRNSLRCWRRLSFKPQLTSNQWVFVKAVECPLPDNLPTTTTINKSI